MIQARSEQFVASIGVLSEMDGEDKTTIGNIFGKIRTMSCPPNYLFSSVFSAFGTHSVCILR